MEAANSRIKTVVGRFVADIWRGLESPLVEIVVHLIVTAVSIIGIATIERLLNEVGLEEKIIPFTTVSLSEWMFDLEILASTVIILVGIYKAARALVK